MNNWTRVRFYLMGFIPGCLFLFFILRSRGCSSPNEIKMEELVNQHWELSDKAKCKMIQCLHLTELGMKIELTKYEIDFDLSEPRKVPCKLYYIKSKTANGDFTMIANDCDTITRIDDIQILNKNMACDCENK